MAPQTAILILFLASDVSAAAPGKDGWRARLQAAEECKTQGRLREAERLLWSALDEARLLEPDPAPSATVYHELAGFYQDAGQCDRAARAYRRSVELWAKAGASGERYLLRTANHLVGLHLECGATGAAERAFRSLVAPRLAAAGGREPDADVAQALTNLGSIEYKKGRYSDARSHYEKALALRERLSAEPAEIGVLLTNLAFALLRAG
jgi:tetratricopeptide (TPR) repeat protein